MALANLSLSSTFTEHIIRTNQSIKVINDIENLTHPLANIALGAANTASNVANMAVGYVLSNTEILTRMTNGANTIISTMYNEVYNDSNVARVKSNIAYNQSNIAYDISNAAYNTANSFVANSSSIIANTILSNTNTYNIIVSVAGQHIDSFLANLSINAVSTVANTALLVANAAFGRANLANGTANTALSTATSAADTAAAAFSAANAAGSSTTVVAAFTKGNAAHLTANAAFTIANTSLNAANNATDLGTLAFDSANSIYSYAQASLNVTIAAFNKANTAGINVFNETTSAESTFYPALVRVTSGPTNQMNVSSSKLYFKPSTGELTSYGFNSLSDENVKENIVRIENALELIEQLNGVNFTWKETHQKSSGVVAQNLINVVPHLVYSASDTPLTVNYDGLSALFIEAIKELNSEIKKIKDLLGI